MAFSEASRILDSQLERARTRLVAAGITMRDESNRSGFDKSGFPYFLWSFYFERRRPHGSEIASALVELSYLEPPDADSKREVRERCLAEVFQIGQLSRIRREGERSLDFHQVSTSDMAALVLDSMERVEHDLPSAT